MTDQELKNNRSHSMEKFTSSRGKILRIYTQASSLFNNKKRNTCEQFWFLKIFLNISDYNIFKKILFSAL